MRSAVTRLPQWRSGPLHAGTRRPTTSDACVRARCVGVTHFEKSRWSRFIVTGSSSHTLERTTICTSTCAEEPRTAATHRCTGRVAIRCTERTKRLRSEHPPALAHAHSYCYTSASHRRPHPRLLQLLSACARDSRDVPYGATRLVGAHDGTPEKYAKRTDQDARDSARGEARVRKGARDRRVAARGTRWAGQRTAHFSAIRSFSISLGTNTRPSPTALMFGNSLRVS